MAPTHGTRRSGPRSAESTIASTAYLLNLRCLPNRQISAAFRLVKTGSLRNPWSMDSARMACARVSLNAAFSHREGKQVLLVARSYVSNPINTLFFSLVVMYSQVRLHRVQIRRRRQSTAGSSASSQLPHLRLGIEGFLLACNIATHVLRLGSSRPLRLRLRKRSSWLSR